MQDLLPAAGCRWPRSTSALIWAICALGLNIVVGYAGLLDLGYVAFWAIGGYAAGWLMSSFFNQVNVHSSARAGPASAAGHPPQLLAGAARRRRVLRAVRRDHRRADAAAAQRLPGAGHARLRRDHPAGLHNGDNIAGFNLSNGTKGITPVDRPIRSAPGVAPSSARSTCACKFLIFVALAAF